jgi:hypothetical protein
MGGTVSAAEHEAAIGRLLAELGDTADEVADTLRAKGIKGRPKSGCGCPVARLLEREGYTQPWVHGEIYVERDDLELRVDFTEAIEQFIERFDDGVYLDLVEVSR